jgi:exodeoxyribonuclease VII large subunit
LSTPPQTTAVAAEKSEPEIYSISDLNRLIKGQLEREFALVWVRGEISNFKNHTSGHFYFNLKDAKASIKAVMFKGANRGLRFRPEDGMEVMIRGRISVYEPRGDYQIMCELMEPVGAGALQKAFEQLKAKLQKEGLFEAARKRAIPKLPNHIAIVTSATGAAIRDMLNVLERRFRGVHITLVPTIVQGEMAPPQIVAALEKANRLADVDVIIVGRGGGSIEDLWAFNDERVARAIAQSRVPTISAVGHEVDFTIADFVADLRAPTPSAAAELVVQNAADLTERIGRCTRAMRTQMQQRLQGDRRHLEGWSKRLIDPKRKLQDLALRCDDLTERLEMATQRYFEDLGRHVEMFVQRLGTPLERVRRGRERLQLSVFQLRAGQQKRLESRKRDFAQMVAVLESLNPLRVVSRGYSLVSRADGAIVKNSRHLQIGESVDVRFASGSARARIESIESANEGEV